MPQNSPNFNLPYFVRGSDYSARSDYRRFVALDYNMESYVGIIGIGVLDGWTIEQVSGTTIQILPGSGIINGYSAESPYTFKRRSDIVSGEREYGVVTISSVPEPSMTSAELAHYTAVRREYEPSYTPSPPVENSWIKAVTPYQITLGNNQDVYIVATRKFVNPYPALGDYPYQTLDEPNRSDYSSYGTYFAALNLYNAELDAIWQYQWRDSSANHFTEVEFSTKSIFVKSASQILLGAVSTRDNTIENIDVSGVDSIDNFRSKIEEFAGDVLNNHHHGGDGTFDPPSVLLTTDIRDTALKSYDSSTGKSQFTILSNKVSGVELGHKHTFSVNSEGNGYTVDQIGSGASHWHKITDSVVQTQETSVEHINEHTHLLPSVKNDTLDDDTQFIVYVDDEVFGTETSPNVEINFDDNTVSLFGYGTGLTYSTYSTTFNYYGSEEPYTFTKKASNLLSFMLAMEVDFGTRHGNDLVTEIDGIQNVDNHPFLFLTTDGALVGLEPLEEQCSIGQQLQKNAEDVFLFTPQAAKNIPVTLVEKNTDSTQSYNVKIEILDNSEVTGQLKIDSIAYIRSDKFTTGTFSFESVPFISHTGRIGEEFLPFQYPMVSNDGVKYSVVPYITNPSNGHYHNLFLNENSSGVTDQTFIDDDPIYYAYDDNNSYFIQHVHGVILEDVSNVSSEGLNEWQGDSASTEHNHSIIKPVYGDPRIVYSIVEDKSLNLFAGTSSGLMCITNEKTYLFTINEVPIYIVNDDLWTAFNLAKPQYEKKTGLIFDITEDVYLSQITVAEANLLEHGDSNMVYGSIDPITGQDKTMIELLDYFDLPNFKYQEDKRDYEVEDDETVVGFKLIDRRTGEEMTASSLAADVEYALENNTEIDENNYVELSVVERNMQEIPSWSLVIKSEGDNERIISTMPDVSANIVNVVDDFYLNWNHSSIPFYSGVLKKIFVDQSGNFWTPTENGLLVSRSYQNGLIFSLTQQPSISPLVTDVTEGELDSVFCSTGTGVSKTTDGGKSWEEVLTINGGIKQVMRDYKVLAIVLYAIAQNREIYKSQDNGLTWEYIGSLPSESEGDAFVFNGKIFISEGGNLISGPAIQWKTVLEERVYSFTMSYDNSKMLIGAYNKIYESPDGQNFVLRNIFEGSKPLPVLSENGEKIFSGYAYNNKSNAFYFKELIYTDRNITALVDFGKWIAERGGWDEDVLYDIYIDRQLALSTKLDIDKRDELNYQFLVNNDFGILDFAKSTGLITATEIFDESLSVESSNEFGIGDRILVVSNAAIGFELPSRPDSVANLLTYSSELETYYARVAEIKNMTIFAQISGVVGNSLALEQRIDKIIELPATVYKIPNMEGDTDIFTNIYDSYLSEIGVNTHDDTEDAISIESDGRPYQLNNAYLSNLLQLTQAVRFIYPDINEKFINTDFFDFKYSSNPLDPNYIGNYIDLLSSDIFNNTSFDSLFSRLGAKTIHNIFAGTGNFLGKLFVATDIGLFWTDTTLTYENNWTYVRALDVEVFDIRVYGQDTIFAATVEGTYSSTDLVVWTLLKNSAISFPSTRISYRWLGADTVTITAHSGLTYNNLVDPDNQFGVIKSDTDQYLELRENRKITLTGAGTHNGVYTIKEKVSDRELYLFEVFPDNDTENHTSMVIEMASWWENFEGEDNLGNINLNNTLLVGGENNIATSNDGVSWKQGEIQDASNFSISDFEPLSSGVVFAAANGTDADEQTHYILSSSNLGSKWNIHSARTEVRGLINSYHLTNFRHTAIDVTYSYPENLKYIDGQYDKLTFAIFDGNVLLYQGICIWNDKLDGKDYIYILDNDVTNILDSYTNLTFELWPSKINSITEGNNHEILFGTERGIYTDNQTTLIADQPGGEIISVDFNGTVNRIDLPGKIKSVSSSPSTLNVVLQVTVDDNISSGSLVDQTLYVVDLDPVQAGLICSNSSTSTTGEVQIELNTPYDSIWSTYNGKNITIVGDKTKLYVSFETNIETNQFVGGIVTVISNENLNIGKEYNIESNTKDYLQLSLSLEPVSYINSSTSDNDNVIVGQNIRAKDDSNRTTLFVKFDRSARRDQYAGFSLRLSGTSSLASTFENVTIYSNTTDTLVVNPINDIDLSTAFSEGDRFVPVGIVYVPLVGFNNRKTSSSSDHIHDLDLIGKQLNGKLASFDDTASSIITISVSNTNGFSDELVQRNSDLLKNAKIRFFNLGVYGTISVWGTIISHTASTITLTMDDSSRWDFSDYNSTKASIGWDWSINSETYGYTKETYYKDFVSSKTLVTANINYGDVTVTVENTSTITNGDKIKIEDVVGGSEDNYILSVDSPTQITLTSSSKRSYVIGNSPQIKVLTSYFSNNHEHMVRKNQVQKLVITEYLDRGYPSSHTHTTQAILPAVNDIFVRPTEIVAIGDAETIYKSYNDGGYWLRKVNLNGFLEGGESISAVTCGDIDNGTNKIVVGTQNGSIFVEGT